VQYRWVTLISRAPINDTDWARVPGVSAVDHQPDGLRLRVSGSLDAVIKQAAQFTIDDLRIEEPSLEEIFLAYYGSTKLHD
jgi:ABC-2 type transport system ATP-binding protein